MQLFAQAGSRQLDPVQQFSMLLMSVLVLLTFVGSNMQALLWQSSDWLVSTVLPAVVIDLTNNERLDNARPQLSRNIVLDQAATAKAQHMADNEYFAHFAPDGTTPWEFFQSAGYVYAHAGENLAIHFTDSAEVVEAWMLSPAHRKNIVDPKFREIGVGTARGTFDGYDTVYVVQLFGTPAATPAPTPTPTPTPAPAPAPAPALPPPVVVSAPAPVVVAALPAPVDILPVEPVAVLEPVSDAVLDSSETATIADGVVLAEANPVVLSNTPEPTEILPAPIETAIAPPAPPVDPVLITTVTERGVLVETQLATSSGLAVATMVESSSSHAGATMASIVTRPNLVLQILYGIVASLIVVSLLYALIVDVRRLHYVQVSYSLLLLVVMGGLWFLHTSLTSGAVIM
jgi:uncharacterized protein YkwD